MGLRRLWRGGTYGEAKRAWAEGEAGRRATTATATELGGGENRDADGDGTDDHGRGGVGPGAACAAACGTCSWRASGEQSFRNLTPTLVL